MSHYIVAQKAFFEKSMIDLIPVETALQFLFECLVKILPLRQFSNFYTS